jgi:hypothetical protein
MPESFPALWAQATPMIDRIMPHDIIPIIAITLGVGGSVLIALTAIIVGNWRKARDRKLVASLIQDMLDRNMTAAEIQQVMSGWQAASETDLPVAKVLRAISPQSGAPAKPAKFA